MAGGEITFIRLPPRSCLVQCTAEQGQDRIQHGRRDVDRTTAVSAKVPVYGRARVGGRVLVSFDGPGIEGDLLFFECM